MVLEDLWKLNYTKPQILLNSDRIVLNAKKMILVFFTRKYLDNIH